MKRLEVLVLSGYGLNCDYETIHACEAAGAAARKVHINSLIDGSVSLDRFQLMIFIGGFSWADDHGAGVIQAVRMKTNLGERILEFVRQGKLILGICNGFQTLVNLGLLPGFDGDYHSRSLALTYNDCGNFRDQWVHLAVNPRSACVFTRGLKHLQLPVRHGEGKLYCSASVLAQLRGENQIVLQYALPDGAPADGRFPFNPNGSLNDIAGVCDSSGRIFGLMPHPEAYHHWSNHPEWTRYKVLRQRRIPPQKKMPELGTRIFQNALDYLRQS